LVIILESLFLVSALSLDAFVASFSYGATKIKIPLLSAVIISLITTVMLGGALFLGALLSSFLDYDIAKLISGGVLIIIGLVKLYDNIIKEYIEKTKSKSKVRRVKPSMLKVLVHIYSDPRRADLDKSKILSLGEAAILSIILSIDSLTAGFGAGFSDSPLLLILSLSLVLTTLFIFVGALLGRLFAKKVNLNLSWLSGAVLVVLGVVGILL